MNFIFVSTLTTLRATDGVRKSKRFKRQINVCWFGFGLLCLTQPNHSVSIRINYYFVPISSLGPHWELVVIRTTVHGLLTIQNWEERQKYAKKMLILAIFSMCFKLVCLVY